MALYSAGVEYGIHCLLFLADEKGDSRESSVRTLAELQGVPPELLAKVFTRLAKAGLVAATEGVRGGFRLARPANEISVLDVVRAIDGDKSIFECREVRALRDLRRQPAFLGDPQHLLDPRGDAHRAEAHGRSAGPADHPRPGTPGGAYRATGVRRRSAALDGCQPGRTRRLPRLALGAYGAAPQARFAENTIVDCGANRAGVSPYPIARGRRRAAAGPPQWPVTNLRDR